MLIRLCEQSRSVRLLEVSVRIFVCALHGCLLVRPTKGLDRVALVRRRSTGLPTRFSRIGATFSITVERLAHYELGIARDDRIGSIGQHLV